MEDRDQRPERTLRRTAQGAQNVQEPSESGALAEGKAVIEEMDRLFREASQTPIVKTHRLIREDAYEDLMGQLRIVLPKMVREAQGVLARRDEITEDAETQSRARREEAERFYRDRREEADAYDKQTRTDAENYRMQLMTKAQEEAEATVEDARTRAQQIIEAAQQQAQRLVEESEISRRAQAFASQIRQDAEERAASVMQQAAHQTDLMLSGAAAALSRSAGEMAQLRDSLLSPGQGDGQNTSAERTAR
ncbi:MAG: hypothetical protein IJ573_03365 [Clostridia bacterium]|nr:hypothetical protein [Clostridia bacterium]